jgi:hypothetical protein
VQLSEIDGALGGLTPAVGVILNDDIGPEVIDDFYTTDEEQDLVVDVVDGVLRNDVDDDGDELTVTVATPPSASQGVLTMNLDGSFTFTPTEN